MSLWINTEMKWMVLSAMILHCKAILDRGLLSTSSMHLYRPHGQIRALFSTAAHTCFFWVTFYVTSGGVRGTVLVGLLVNRSSDWSCTTAWFSSPGCPRPTIALQCRMIQGLRNTNIEAINTAKKIMHFTNLQWQLCKQAKWNTRSRLDNIQQHSI